MIKQLVHHLKLFVILIHDLVYKLEKVVRFLWTGNHEFERICELHCDIYEKTMQFDRWLFRSRCQRIRKYLDRYLNYKSSHSGGSGEDAIDKLLQAYQPTESTRKTATLKSLEAGDAIIVDFLNELTDELSKIILKSKKVKMNPKLEAVLRDIIYRIVSYNLSLVAAHKLACTKYDSENTFHKNKLISLWNNLVQADQQRASEEKRPRVLESKEHNSMIRPDDKIESHRWSLIGFQGEDPGTDFRGMGLLGLEQLEYLSRKPRYLALDLLRRSLDKRYEYPFAITGINITYNLIQLYKDGSMKHLYYDYGDNLFRNKTRNLNLIKTINDLYVELYLRFDCFWRESKPENILVFNELMEEFVDVIRMDMSTRNFSMKFIY